MAPLGRLVLAARLALLALAAGVPAALGAAPIENVATVSLQFGGQRQIYSSNRVVADRLLPPAPSTVTFLRPSTAPGSVPMPTDGGQCRASNGTFSSTAPLASPGRVPTPSSGVQAQVFHAGETLIVSLADANRNANAGTRETIEIALTTSDGDEEILRLLETEANSGLFAARILTVVQPPAATRFDCRLSLGSDVRITASYIDADYPADRSTASASSDPTEFVFDSQTGAPISGAQVTLIDVATGAPAIVFADDGVTPFRSTITTGGTVTDVTGRTVQFPAGGFRFPVVAPGTYRIQVTPPAGYSGPSQANLQDVARLLNASGTPYSIDADGSLLRNFTTGGAGLFRIDIPLDPTRMPMLVTKSAAVSEASAGDFILYSVTVRNNAGSLATNATVLVDTMSEGLRFKSGSLRIDGRPAADPVVDASGAGLRIALGTVAARSTTLLTYVAQVTSAARPGEALNRVQALASGVAASNEARAAVTIRPLLMSDAATLIGRIMEGDCSAAETTLPGVPGVRILMQDGTYVLSDRAGLFHFEGVRPGTHVVQLDVASLPAGYEAVHCIRNSRHAGRAFSQFVDVRGGALWRTNFHLRRTAVAPAAPAVAAGAAAAPAAAEDWFAGQSAGTALLFPDAGHNPRSPSLKVVVKHLPASTVRVKLNGVLAPDLNVDSARDSAARDFQIIQWQGLPLDEGDNRLDVEVRGADGALVERFQRTIHYANSVARADIVPSLSKMIADGRTRPVIAVRLTDRAGKPVRQGVTGNFSLSAPYRVASDLDLQQARQLAGAERTQPTWQVSGDNGVALIELAPTTQAGSIELGFIHQIERRQVRELVRGWMQPGDQPFVVVGFGAGTIGFNTLSDHQEKLLDRDASKRFTDGQLAFFAKGRILGKWLLTVAFDSDKKTGRNSRRPLGGVIDPQRYYDIYADGTEQAYDAASTRKIYLRLERPQFYALFGDYETGFNDTQLARYNRSLTGVKGEYRGDHVAVQAFAAQTGFTDARDEIQGSGLSGPYRLTRRDIVLNSDKVRIETRDRFRSERIIASRSLTRHADYDIDYDAGTLRFRQPVLSRDSDFNPVFIVADYETRGDATKKLNGGLRVATRLAGGAIEAGATAIRDADPSATTDLVALDAKVRLRADTELRAELAHSRSVIAGDRRQGDAVLVELEHRGEKFDALAYFRQQDADFGVGQLNRSESGTRKFGVDAHYLLARGVSLTGSAWHEDVLATGASRDAARGLLEYRSGATALRAGLQFARDEVPSGETLISRQLTFGGSQGLFGNRLTLDADAAIGLGSSESLDFPDRYRLGLGFAIRPDVRLLVAHEITRGDKVDTSTTSAGIEASPWRGSRLGGTLNQQGIGENGGRTFALYGLSQAFALNPRWSVDVAVDGSRTLRGDILAADIVNPAHPVASGGHVGAGDTLSDDFWAVSTGATYRSPIFSWTGRIEFRRGDRDDRFNVTSALLRQTQDGISFAASAQYNKVKSAGGTDAMLAIANASLAWRPTWSRWAVLDKLELRWDEVRGGLGTTDNLLGFDGLAVTGDARTRRIVNNLAINLVSGRHDDDGYERSQLSLYLGSKYVFDSYGTDDYSGFASVLGVEARRDLSDRIDLGFNASVRHVTSSNTFDFMVGPSLGISPMTNAWVTLGYNFVGFGDRDFSEARFTRRGAFVTLRFKFDQDSSAALFGRSARTR